MMYLVDKKTLNDATMKIIIGIKKIDKTVYHHQPPSQHQSGKR